MDGGDHAAAAILSAIHLRPAEGVDAQVTRMKKEKGKRKG
jgi:hypothetical protein